MYFCPGAMHAPHHVPKEWADKYKGKFDAGWDAYREQIFARRRKWASCPPNTELSRHDPDVQDWSKLSAEEKKLYARMMEVFAGFLNHTDHHIGRLIEFLKEIGEFDNTLIMVLSDNGASAEGGPTGHGQRRQVLQQRAGIVWKRTWRPSTNSAARSTLTTTPGAGRGPATRRSAAGNARPTAAARADPFIVALAQRNQSEGRDTHAIRPCHRHGADGTGGGRHRAADAYQGRHAIAH